MPRRVDPLPLSRAVRCAWILAAALFAFAGVALAQSDSADATSAGDPTSAQSSTRARTYEVTLWTTANGLPQGTVNELVQTRDGAVWIATFGGLLLFDGSEFRTFDLDTLPTLPSIRVTALTLDGPNGIWVGTQSGHLLRMRDGVVVESRELAAPRGEIVELAEGRGGTLWTRTSSGRVVRWVGDQEQEVLGGGTAGTYENLALNAAGDVAVGVGRSVRVFDAEGRERTRVEVPQLVDSLAEAGPDGFWIGFSDGLALLRGDRFERIAFDPPFSERVSAIWPQADGTLWLGTSAGPRLAVPNEAGAPWQLQPPLPGIPAQFMVRAMCVDREGNLWAGSFGQGLARVTPHHVDRVTPSTADTIVTAIIPNGEGGAWVALSCRGIVQVDSDATVVSSIPLKVDEGKATCVLAMARDPSGRMWVAFGESIHRQEGDGWRIVSTTEGVVNPYCALAVGPDGTAWIGTSTGEITALGPDERIVRTLLLPPRPVTFLPAPDGSLWIGGSSMLWHVVGDTVITYDQDDGLARGDVRDLLLDDDGSLWIATYGGGLSRLHQGRIDRVSRDQGLPDNSLSCVLDDHRGRLWISSNRGLIVIAKDQLRAYLAGGSKELDFVLLGPKAGMPEANYGFPPGFHGPDGRLWFGTISGAVRVDPRGFPYNHTPPSVRIRSVVAEDVALSFTDTVEVPAGTRRLVVNFTAYGQTNPEQVRFRSRLLGFDDQWVDSGAQPQVSFTALPPGNYTLQVKARNEEGVWNDRPLSLAMTIEPTWWQTATFKILAVLAAGALVLGLHRFRVEVIRRNSTRLIEATEGRVRAEERESRLREELAHVARVATAGELATSLAHEVNQPLAAIVANAQAGRRMLNSNPADRVEVDTILDEIAQQGRRASEVIRRLREFLTKHEEERRPCDVNTLLRDTLPLLRRELEDHAVRIELDLRDGLPSVPVDAVQIQQVLVNLIKNACEAMAHTNGERSLFVRTESWGDGVRLVVRDTGPGLSPAIRDRVFQPYVTTKPSGMGLGLAICRTIVEAHAGSLVLAPNEGGGATFQIDLPGHVATAQPERRADRPGWKSATRANTLLDPGTTLEGSPSSDTDDPASEGKVTT